MSTAQPHGPEGTVPEAAPDPVEEPTDGLEPETKVAAPPAEEPTDGLEWRRVHIATPAIRSWKAFVAIVAVIGWQAVENVDDARTVAASGGWRWVLLGILVVVIVAAVSSVLAWRFTRYAVGDSAVHLHTGIVFRKQRQARLDRLQSVDVVRPLLARLAGLSQLTLEVAGAAGSNVELAFLRDEEAMALRAELLAKAAGVQRAKASGDSSAGTVVGTGESAAQDTDPVAHVPLRDEHEEAPERVVAEVPVPRLIGSIVLSGTTIGFVLVMLGLIGAALAALTGAIGSGSLSGASNFIFLLPAIFGLASFVWSRFNGGYGFRAAISPDGIRLSRGLLETRSQTIAPGRVQALEIVQPLLWRRAGWYRVRINVAGYGALGETDETSTTLLPVGDLEQALLAVWLVLPDLGTKDPVAVLTEALHGSGDEGGFTLMSQRVRPIAPLTYRRNGFHVTDRALVLRRGRLRRVVQIVPHERTQSLGLSEGPLARALRVVTFTVHSVSGPVRPFLDNLDHDVAARLMAEQAARARDARALDRSERWMAQEDLG